jgi:hypothetical protein
MNLFIKCGCAALTVLLVPAMAQAQTAPRPPQLRADPTAAGDAQREALALELAELLNSEALTRTQSVRLMNETVPRSLAASPEFAAMEKQFPGIGKAVIDAMAPIVIEGTVKRLPELWRRLAPAYFDAFTADELREVIAFYRSPLGTRIIQIMGEESDFAGAMAEAMHSPNGNISQNAVRQGIEAGSAGLVRRLSAEDLRKIGEFMATPAGKKVGEIAPRVQQIAAEWGNDQPPELQQQVQAAVVSAVQRYTGKKP